MFRLLPGICDIVPLEEQNEKDRAQEGSEMRKCYWRTRLALVQPEPVTS